MNKHKTYEQTTPMLFVKDCGRQKQKESNDNYVVYMSTHYC